MSFKKLISIFITTLITNIVIAQTVYSQLNPDYNHLIDRNEIKSSQLSNVHTGFKPYQRVLLTNLIETSQKDSTLTFSSQDQFNQQYILNDNWEYAQTEINSRKPLFKYFYTKPNASYEFHNHDFIVQVNPVINFQIGKEKDIDGNLYINSKGVEIRGIINRKVGFYSFLTDNQINYATYVNTFINQYGAVPGEGFHKVFKATARDFITARGYFTVNATKNIHLQFGHDKNFVGNGFRSLILSDFSNSYLFLKVETNIWKLKYTNLFAQMNAMGTSDFVSNTIYPRKYFALHHLSLNLSKNFNLGLFESIVFGRSDSTQQGNFDLNYLNPIIFYRWAEQQNGSQDNANIGLDFKWNFRKHYSLYGQVTIDEFLIHDLLANNGSIRNKQGVQMGLKIIDIFNIPTLDAQLETNIVRPYTYAHFNNYSNYSHYGQPLAHPYGANFKEMIAVLRYQPINRLQLTGKIIYATMGVDINNTILGDENYGGNIFKPYTTVSAKHDLNNYIGQGIATQLTYVCASASYMLKHNLFIDLEIISRNYTNSLSSTKSVLLNLGLRLNIHKRVQEF